MHEHGPVQGLLVTALLDGISVVLRMRTAAGRARCVGCAQDESTGRRLPRSAEFSDLRARLHAVASRLSVATADEPVLGRTDELSELPSLDSRARKSP